MEILVVIAVIALLAGMMVPSLHRAREHAYDATCRSNLHHLWTFLGAAPDLAVPDPGAWVAFVRSCGGQAALICPKDHPEDQPSQAFAVGGNVVQIDPPTSALFNHLESNSLIRVFQEQESFVLPWSVGVNISSPGTYLADHNASAGTVAAGTTVDSHFLLFDPVGDTKAATSGSVSFGGEILGLIVLDGQLDDTDGVLGAAGTAYPTGMASRGVESGQEHITLQADRRTLTIHRLEATFPGENIRVLTAPGGLTSYGMNNQTGRHPRPGQLMLVDYAGAVVDVDGASPDDDFGKRLAPRHLGRANAVFVDGSVRSFRPEQLSPAANGHLWQP